MFKFSSFRLSAVVVRSLLGLLLLSLNLPAAAQAPVWQSARVEETRLVAGNNASVCARAYDTAGNVYLVGSFANTIMLGSTTLTSLGRSDVFVAKFNPASNQFVWAQRAGGLGNDYPTTLAVSGTNVYVAGEFNSPTASFGSTTLANADVSTTNPSTDVFVAKLTDAGSTSSFAWAQRAGGTYIDNVRALAVSGTSVYVAGSYYSRTADFNTTTLFNAGNYDMFVAKLTDTGNFVWAQRAGAVGADIATTLAVSGTTVYVAGYFYTPRNTPGLDFGSTSLTSMNESEDVFVAKLSDAGGTGSFIWAQRAGGMDRDYVSALAVSGTSIYVAGTFTSSPTYFGTTTLNNAGN